MDRIKIFPRIYPTNTGRITANTILMSSFFLSKINKLVNHNTESCGYVICRKDFESDFTLYIVEHIYVTTEGRFTSVYQTKKLNLPKQNSGIEFHIHPSYLTAWQDSFSGGDIISLDRRREENPSYKHILFTAQNVIIYGIENLDFRIVNSSTEEARQNIISKNNYWESIVGKSVL